MKEMDKLSIKLKYEYEHGKRQKMYVILQINIYKWINHEGIFIS